MHECGGLVCSTPGSHKLDNTQDSKHQTPLQDIQLPSVPNLHPNHAEFSNNPAESSEP